MSGLIVFPILLIFVFCAYIIYRITFYFTQKKRLSRIVFAFVLFLPFLDLIPQKIIKTYYQLFLMEPTVYSYPEFDKDGKIHSLSIEVDSLYREYRLKDKDVYNYHFSYISEFLEQKSTYIDDKNYNKKIRLNLKNNTYKFVPKLESKYMVRRLPKENGLFGLYKKRITQIIDVEKNEILGESSYILFDSDYSYFRNKILLLGVRSPFLRIESIYDAYPKLKRALKFKLIKANKWIK